MQRIATCVLALAAIAVISGCKDKNEGMSMGAGQSASLAYEEPSTDYYGPGSLNPPGGNSEYDVYTPADAKTSSGYSANAGYTGATPTPAAFSGSAGGARHTVAKGDTLYSIARAYYNGDMSKWRDIYNANRNTIRDPNRLSVGQQLVIP